MKTNFVAIWAVLLLLLCCRPGLAAPAVLLIWDTQGPQTESLKKSLEDSSIKVVLSQTEQSRYDGTNPSLAGIDVVSTGFRVRSGSGYPPLYSTLLADRPAAGQRSTWLVVRVDLSDSVPGLRYRRSVAAAAQHTASSGGA